MSCLKKAMWHSVIYIINKRTLVSSFILITYLYLHLKHLHLEPYNVKLLNMPFMPLGVLLRPLGLKCVPPPYVCTPWGSLKPLGAHIYSLESQLCPLGLFYAPWGSSMHLPFKRACPPSGVYPPPRRMHPPSFHVCPHFHPFVPPFHPCAPHSPTVRAPTSSMCTP
jgi:hypothetical protein